MTYEAEPAGDIERSAALDGWVVAFDREMEQSGDFATSVGAMTAHGCFDVRGVVERWILANPSDDVPVAQVQPVLDEPVHLHVGAGTGSGSGAAETSRGVVAGRRVFPQPVAGRNRAR